MTTSPAGRALIESFEGFSAEAYLPTPDDVPTIGYGHTKGVRMGDTCTHEQADAFMAEDLNEAETVVTAKVRAGLQQNQFDALVSIVFNIGPEHFGSSTLLKLLNEGELQGAANQFLVWDKQNGKVLEGLVRRRFQERSLFLTQ